MSKKQRYKGLKFNYKYEGNILTDKYKTIEDFLETEFPKNNNPMSPNYNTEIFNITWNSRKPAISNQVKTLADLKNILLKGCYISNNDIRESRTSIYQRKSVHSIEQVKEIVKDVLFEEDKEKARVEIDGDIVKGNSQRYQTFFTKGLKCSCCGIEGAYFAKEKKARDKSYHLNLYALDENGEEVLMTKDHIKPRSKGGKDHIDNYQTMCIKCNLKKGNKIEK